MKTLKTKLSKMEEQRKGLVDRLKAGHQKFRRTEEDKKRHEKIKTLKQQNHDLKQIISSQKERTQELREACKNNWNLEQC